jgi:hypothetical protein
LVSKKKLTAAEYIFSIPRILRTAGRLTVTTNQPPGSKPFERRPVIKVMKEKGGENEDRSY